MATPGIKDIRFHGIDLKVLPEFPNYGFSRDGRAFNLVLDKLIGSVDKESGQVLLIMTDKDGKPNRKRRMHRMIIWAWTGIDPDNNEVEHINEDLTDNHLDNLRVIDRAERRRKVHQKHTGHQQRSAEKRGTPLMAIDPEGRDVRFPSVREAARQLGVDDGTIHHHLKTHTSFRGWLLAKEDLTFEGEEWREVIGYPGLKGPVFVSSFGRIRVDRQPTYGNIPGNYYSYSLTVNGKKVDKRVSEMVCWAFHGPRPITESLPLQVNHIDHNPRNNRPENLEWLDHVRNTQLGKGTHFVFEGKNETLTFYSENELLRSGRFRPAELPAIYAAAVAGTPYQDYTVTVSHSEDRREERESTTAQDPSPVRPVTRLSEDEVTIYTCDLFTPLSRTPSMSMRLPAPGVDRRPIPGFELYDATEEGQIIIREKDVVIKTHFRSGIVCANVMRDDTRRRNYVDAALLVALAFAENPDSATYVAVRAVNGNPYDRRLENLEWCTAQEYTSYRREMKKAAAAAVNDETKADDA